MGKDKQEAFDSLKTTPEKTSTEAGTESQQGMKDLTERHLKESRRLKDGGSSGISGAFGKPVICEQPVGVTTLDTQGRVNSITYANGKSNTFEYDDSTGKLSKVTNSDGTSWKHEKGLWFQYDRDGHPVDHFDGKMYVTKYGEIVQKDDNDNVRVVQRDGAVHGVQKFGDGSKTTINSDGSEVNKEDNGRVHRVKYPNGDSNTFEYDEKGRLSKVTSGDDSAWVRDNDSWVKKDKNGKPVDRFDGTFTVNSNGDLVQKNGDDWAKTTSHNGEVKTVVKYSDHTTGVIEGDNSKVTTDSAGRVVEKRYPSGETNEFEYDAQGRLMKVQNSNGSYCLREKGHWYKYNKDKQLVEDFDGDMTVNKHGEVVAKGPDSDSFLKNIKPDDPNVQETKLSDGTRRFKLAGGSTLDIDPKGNKTLKKEDGTVIHSDSDGAVSTKQPDGSYTWIGEKGTRISTDRDGNTTIEDVNGDVSTVYKTGTTVIHKHDGREIKRNKEGYESISQGGKTTVKGPDGKEIPPGTDVKFPTGT